MAPNDIIVKKEQLFTDPREQLRQWFSLAEQSGQAKPEGFALATVCAEGKPHCRWVLHKGFIDGDISFYTNYTSDKAQDISHNANVAASFYWDLPLDIQVRVEGKAVKLTKEQSEAYFHSRPKGSQLGAWASPQSKEIQSRDELIESVEEVSQRFAEKEVIPLPEFWGGYKIIPESFDFMLLREDRLHDRYRFDKIDGVWQRKVLAP